MNSIAINMNEDLSDGLTLIRFCFAFGQDSIGRYDRFEDAGSS